MARDSRIEKLYTLQEVAEILKVSTRTVHRHIESGKLSAVRIGRLYRIKESALQRFINYK